MADTVEVTIGKRIPSRGWTPGQKVMVPKAEAASLRARGMLHEQVLAEAGRKNAAVDRSVAERESTSGEMHRRLIRDLEAKLQAEREKNIELAKQNEELRAAAKAATAEAEAAKAAASRASDTKK